MPLEAHSIDVYVIIPLMRCADHDDSFVRRMKTLWVPRAIAEESLMSTIFLASCRHLAIHTQSQAIKQYHNKMAYHYKLKVLASLRDAIAVEAPTFSDSTVAMAIMLTYDEVRSRSLQVNTLEAPGLVNKI